MARELYFAVDPNKFSAFGTLLSDVLGDDFLKRFSGSELNQITAASLGYIFRLYSYADMTTITSFLPSKQNHKLRQALISDHKILLGVKLALLRCRQFSEFPDYCHIRIFRKCGLSPNDVQLYRCLNKMHLPLFRLPETLRTVYPTTVQERCAKFLTTIDVWIKKFMYRKLSFVAKNNGYSVSDFIQDMEEKATATYYFLYPFLQGPHLINSIKRSVHNYGIKQIHHFNYQCRQRLALDPMKGHHVPTVGNLNVQAEASGEEEVDVLDALGSKRLHPNADMVIPSYNMTMINDNDQSDCYRYENRLHLEKVIERANSPKRQTLKLMLLAPNSEFVAVSSQLMNRTFQSVEDVFLACRTTSDFLRLIANYLSVPPLTVRNYLREAALGIEKEPVLYRPQTVTPSFIHTHLSVPREVLRLAA